MSIGIWELGWASIVAIAMGRRDFGSRLRRIDGRQTGGFGKGGLKRKVGSDCDH